MKESNSLWFTWGLILGTFALIFNASWWVFLPAIVAGVGFLIYNTLKQKSKEKKE